MEIPIISIGNSKGLRIKKAILEKYDIKDKVKLILEKGRIIIMPVSTPRQGWEKSLKEMNGDNHDELLIKDVFDDEILEDWE